MAAAESVNPAASIRHLRAFLAVGRNQSFSKAAQELNLSQPALTMAVRQLEGFVGARLFDRTTRMVSLTPEGRDFLPTAQRVVQDFDLALSDIKAAANSRRGRVAIAAVHSVAARLLPTAISRLNDRHGNMQVQLFDDNSPAIRRRVRANEVDIGICSRDDDPELSYKPMFRDQLGLLVRADHPLAGAAIRLRWADLAGHDFVGFARDTATPRLIRQVPDLPPNIAEPRYEVSSYSPLWAMVAAGNGMTVTAALAAPEARELYDLRFIELTEPVIWRSVHTVTRRGRGLTPVARDLLSEIVGLIRAESGTAIRLG